MKAISSFLSHDRVIIEELDLSLKEKKHISIVFQHQIGRTKFGDDGCVLLAEGLKRNTTLKKLNLEGNSFNKNTIDYHFSDCGITAEGMKTISSFLSQNGIVLEELELSLKKRRNLAF